MQDRKIYREEEEKEENRLIIECESHWRTLKNKKYKLFTSTATVQI